MAAETRLRRSKSLKRILSLARKTSSADEEEPLPYTPVKQKYVAIQVTTDDINVRRPVASPVIPERVSSQRNTWPTTPRERKAGSYAFDTVPTLTRTPWELGRSSRRRHSHRAPLVDLRPLPRRIFEQLPREIYHCILEQLETLHATQTTVDTAGRQTDLKALLLVDKRWHRVAREHLYREVWLPNNDELVKRTVPFQRSKTRLKQLQRTLEECEGLANMVRHLHITADLAAALDLLDQPNGSRRAAFETLADIITLCPSLEYLSGCSPLVLDKISAKLYEPLATRQKLKAHAWNFRAGEWSDDICSVLNAGDLLDCHDRWRLLETLVLCSSDTLQFGVGVVSAMVRRLPSLKHLMLSRLAKQDFHDGTLLSLPALKSLRLEHLEGITDQGVEQLGRGRLAMSLERLSMVGLEITSLRTVQTLITNLSRLQRFTLVQETSPEFQPGMESASATRGIQSSTLQYLHWDALVAGSATTLFANSIASGRLPALRKVKVPCDYDGAIQALCRPIAQQPLNAEDLELIERFNTERYERFLRVAQIQAQLRIRESRQQPSFNVVVHDENRRVSATHVIGSYVGSMESKIEYSLDPDVEGSHYALIDFSDVEAPKWLYEKRNEMERSVQGEQRLELRMLF